MKKNKKVTSRIEKLCSENGVKFTHQRRIIAEVISNSNDHPDANEVYLRANKIDPRISLATVYRTIKLFEKIKEIMGHIQNDNIVENLDKPSKKVKASELFKIDTDLEINIYEKIYLFIYYSGKTFNLILTLQKRS